jgi:hypothetical protein
VDLTTYAGLRDAVGVLVGGSSDTRFADAVEIAVAACEQELDHGLVDPATDAVIPGLRVPEMVSRALLDVDKPFEVLPASCLAVLACAEVVGDREVPMGHVPMDGIGDFDSAYRRRGGRPGSYYSLQGRQIRFGPAGAPPAVVRLTYYAKVPPLASATPCYDVLAAYPNLYLYGTARHVSGYNVDDEALSKWTGFFVGAMRAANRSARNR